MPYDWPDGPWFAVTLSTIYSSFSMGFWTREVVCTRAQHRKQLGSWGSCVPGLLYPTQGIFLKLFSTSVSPLAFLLFLSGQHLPFSVPHPADPSFLPVPIQPEMSLYNWKPGSCASPARSLSFDSSQCLLYGTTPFLVQLCFSFIFYLIILCHSFNSEYPTHIPRKAGSFQRLPTMSPLSVPSFWPRKVATPSQCVFFFSLFFQKYCFGIVQQFKKAYRVVWVPIAFFKKYCSVM